MNKQEVNDKEEIIQKNQLLELQAQEHLKRENNLRRLNETMMSVLSYLKPQEGNNSVSLQEQNKRLKSLLFSLQSKIREDNYKQELIAKISDQNKCRKNKIEQLQKQLWKLRNGYKQQQEINRIKWECQKNIAEVQHLRHQQIQYLQNRVEQLQKLHKQLQNKESQNLYKYHSHTQQLKKEINENKHQNSLLRKQKQDALNKITQKNIELQNVSLKNRQLEDQLIYIRQQNNRLKDITQKINSYSNTMNSFNSNINYKTQSQFSKCQLTLTNYNQNSKQLIPSYISVNKNFLPCQQHNYFSLNKGQINHNQLRSGYSNKNFLDKNQHKRGISPIPSARYSNVNNQQMMFSNCQSYLDCLQKHNKSSFQYRNSFKNLHKKNIATELLCEVCNIAYPPNEFYNHYQLCKKNSELSAFHSHRDRMSMLNKKNSNPNLFIQSPQNLNNIRRMKKSNSKSHGFNKKISNISIGNRITDKLKTQIKTLVNSIANKQNTSDRRVSILKHRTYQKKYNTNKSLAEFN